MPPCFYQEKYDIVRGEGAAATHKSAVIVADLAYSTALARPVYPLPQKFLFMDTKRCYEILGLPLDAPQDEVKEAYRQLAREWHPDKVAHNLKLQAIAQEEMKNINAAYDTLKSYQPASRPASSSKKSQPEENGARAAEETRQREATEQRKREAEQKEWEAKRKQREEERLRRQQEAEAAYQREQLIKRCSV